ncbi:MAG: transporter substrate-binding domain-containing protein [Betaproteobacteria bacterium]|nr:transporter substrate-binding domain-containing protein [Betaproteobacteria bacterium]
MPKAWRAWAYRVSRLAGGIGLLALAVSMPAWSAQTLRVGVYENSPKIGLSGTGQPEGFFVDLIEAIAQREQWQIEYVHGDWNEGLQRLAAGEIDLMPDVALTGERQRLYNFHREPALSSWAQVYARRGSGIRALPDLDGRRVAVLQGSIQEAQFQSLAQSFALRVELVAHKDFAQAFTAVKIGSADAVVTNRFYGVKHAASFNLEDTAIVFAPSTLFFAAPRSGSPATLATIDRHLQAFKQDPSSPYYRSLKRWTIDEVQPAIPSWLLYVGLGFVALLLAAAVGLGLLRREVAARTAVIRRRNEQMATVNHTLSAMGASLDLNVVLEEAIRGALQLSGCEGGVLCVRGAKPGHLAVGARINAAGITDLAPGGGPMCDAVCPAVLETTVKGKAYAVVSANDPQASPACSNVRDPKVRWNIYFPVEIQGRMVGLLCIFSRAKVPPSEHSLELVRELCIPVALAMENARLYAETCSHAAELEEKVTRRTQDLAEANHFLDALIDRISSPIFYKGPDLRFRGCNYAYTHAFGISREEFIGKTVLELPYLPLADREAYQAEDAAVVEAGSTLVREADIPFADGKVHHTLYSVAGFRTRDGAPAGLVGVIVDITALKQVEAELREAKHAAEAADRIKSAFLATMSHELRTPLNSIIGFTGLVLQELPGPLNEEQKKQLSMVRDSSRHLLALINDVLDISKIEAGELKVADEPYELGRSIDKVLGIVRPLAEQKGLSLQVSGRELAPSLRGDARRLEQILLNLLGNAIKFTDRGSINLLLEQVKSDAEGFNTNMGEVIRLKVQDTGPGIKPEDLAELFQPFRQIDSALSRQHEGTGLGLAICRRLAGLMGGQIEAQSVWGEGSVFTLTLPVASLMAEKTT